MEQNINELYQQALEHKLTHKCGAAPYQNGRRLVEILQQYQPQQILEIGTGIGFTAIIMAKALPQARIDTIEKDEEHAQMAREWSQAHSVANQINLIVEPAEQYLAATQKQYDLIFFDGYQIHLEFLAHYERVLKPGGILVLANNHLTSKTSEQFFSGLSNGEKWRILDQFADTTLAIKI